MDDMQTAEALDAAWPPTDPSITEREPRKCRSHEWKTVLPDGIHYVTAATICARCGKPKDEAASRRGKTARNRGNAFERTVAGILGGRRVGQFGDSVDVDVPGWLRVQCKNGGAYPALLDRWLRAIPVQADLLRAVVVGDAPGAGTRRRSLIVLDLEEFASWYAATDHGRDREP